MGRFQGDGITYSKNTIDDCRITKYEIPRSETERVLKELKLMNALALEHLLLSS